MNLSLYRICPVVKLTLIVIFVASASLAFAQNQTVKATPGNIWYYEYLPPDYNNNTNKYPVVFFCHGLGERGDTELDLVNVAKHGPPKHVKNGFKFPFILISPQLKKSYTGWPASYIDQVIEHCKTYLRIDLTRVYLTGLSLGGGGAWTYSQDAILGQKLAAVAPICGASNNPLKACNFGLTNLPVWAFHGDADGTVNVNKSITMVNAINACNPAPNPLAKLTIYAGVAHNSWDRAYLTDNSLHTPNLYQWLMQFQNNGVLVNAGADKTINLPTTSTTLTGSASIQNPNASITSYTWTKVNGPTVTLSNTTSATLSLTSLVAGIYTFRLTALANNNETAYDDVKVTVLSGTNQAPVANAGADKTLTLPTNSITLNGTGSDPDGSVASYSWTKISGPTVTMSGATSANLGLTNLLQGTYSFSLTVTDNLGASATDEVKVIVNAAVVNQPPIANAGADKTVNLPTSTTSLTGTGSDADGNVASYLWEKVSGPAATMTNATTATVSLSGLTAGLYTFRLTVKDNAGASATDQVNVTVVAANQSPIANAGGDITLTLPTNSTNLNGSGSDGDGTISTYAWTQVSGPSSITIANASSATATVNALIQGTYVFRLTVTDDKSATAFDEVNVVVNAAAVNVNPVANAGADITVNLPTNTATVNGSGSDADGTIATYAWTKTSGPAATMSNTNSATLLLNNLVAGIYKFRLTVTDNLGATAFDEMNVTVVSANQSPTANAGTDITIVLPTSSSTLTGSGSDADGTISSYAWTQSSGPLTATISNPTGSTTNISNLIAAGTYVFQLTVTDDKGSSGSDQVSVIVSNSPVNQNPTVSAGADKTITLPINSAVFNGTASDFDGTIASYLWELVSGPSCTLTNATTPTLTVSNTIAGTYTFRFTATDNQGGSSNDLVILTVQPAVVNQSPIVNAGADASLILPVNSAVLNGSATDADGTIQTYTWTKVSGPAATLSGANTEDLTLSNLVEGVYVFQLEATDDKGSTGSDNVTVTVNALNQSPTANAGSDITLDLPINSTDITGAGTDTDGTVSSYVWTFVSGPSTPGMTNENTATVSVSGLMEGAYIFSLTVTDNDGATGVDEMKVIVNAANQAPTVTINTNRNITLPLNQTTFSAVGTDSDGSIVSYQWTQVSGPEAATLTNTNTSTVTVKINIAGVYFFRVTVKDNEDATAYADAKLTVNAATVTQAPTANAGPNKSITLPVNATTLNGSGSDADGTISSYSWSKVSGPSATLTNGNTANLSLSNLLEGTYVFRLTVTDDDALTGSDDVIVTVLPPVVNTPPVANAGPDKVLTLPTNSLNINGSGSDNDGGIITYLWTKLSGPSATITNATQAVVTISNLVEGKYTFRLTVTDDQGATATDDVKVTVNAQTVNQPPVANAGPDKTISLPANTTSLSGSGSDADGSIAFYSWTKISGPAVNISGANTATADLTNLVEGGYVFRLTVTDNMGSTASDDVNVTVLGEDVNVSPVADAGANEVITLPVNSITLFGGASDSDGSIVSYEWTKVSGPSAVLTNASTATLSVSSMLAGTYVFRLTVTDNDGAIDSDEVRVKVNGVATNQAPVADAGNDQTITLPTSIATLNGSGSDADGSIVKYTWVKVSGPTVTLGATDGASLSVSNLLEGIYVFRLEVEDNAGATATDEATITVFSQAVNSIPIANAGSDQTITEPASEVFLSGTGSDSDGSITQITWTQVLGTSSTIITPNSFATNVTSLTAGTYRYRLTITDDKGASAFDEVLVTVLTTGTNQPPMADAGYDEVLKLPNNSIILNGAGTDSDGSIATYLWQKTSGPALSMSGENTSTLSLLNLVEGVYVFRLTVTDDDGASAQDEILVTVFPSTVNLAPVANAGPDKSIDLPQNEMTLTGTVTDENVATVLRLWQKISGPDVIMQNASGDVVSLSGLVEGSYVFRFTATDAEGQSDFDEVTVTVLPASVVPDVPVVDAGEDVQMNLPHNSVVLHATAESPNGLIVSYLWQQTEGAPVNFSPSDESSITLENLTAGIYKFTVTVHDVEGRAASDEVIVFVIDENPQVTPRKLFSPDQDSENATWTIKNSYLLDNCVIEVFDRAGQKVFSSIGYPVPWDGTFNGKPLPEGAYYYVIRCDGQVIKTGSVTIARRN